jgi:glycerophosphoryl diester phosphodiesterase
MPEMGLPASSWVQWIKSVPDIVIPAPPLPAGLITSRAVVARLHRCGWKLFVWTVNRRAAIERFRAWGVDGIITNHPDRAKSCLARR